MAAQAGAPLVQLNPKLLMAKLTAANAQLQLSLENYKRTKQLYLKKVVAKAELDKDIALYRSQLAEQHCAEVALKQTLIRAPFTGQLGLRYVDIGDYIDPSKIITHLNALDPLRVYFRISKTMVPKLRIGQITTIRVSAYPEHRFQATIYALRFSD